MWGEWVFGSVIIMDGWPEDVAIYVELLNIGSIWSMGPCYEALRSR